MKIPSASYTDYTVTSDKIIRYRKVTYIDPDWPGDYVTDYCFEALRRPFFWGLIGKKRWEEVIQTSSIDMGYEFTRGIIGRELKIQERKEKQRNLKEI